ncbi:hypothetical protein [Mucilaginibacter sp. 5C4]|uniref:hypothetical protein n=1 Tax=Mucilaginibacter sp. 5C4 TaxID=3048589 RepID=UPI002AC8E76E|nr:hypothetical protein [Mucilaginibacter sp. 5C4]MEB0301532.1 hypothetical protein [Mucilaginibacter sp. 5C4]WPX25343.1 hypothetical protein RHM67_08715 [Mucilaginibacter sp. 5C4]
MKTAEKNATAVQGTAAKNNQTANRIENRPSLTQKEAKEDENVKNQAPAQTPQVEATHNAEIKTDSPATVDNKSAHIDGQPEKPELKEEPKAEAVKVAEPTAEVKPVKFALNLESTLKVVDDLHRRSIQRVNLIARINQLTAFEVALAQENDELEDNPYQGCKLIIKDDKNREFITTTPGLIRLVSQYIFDACSDKLAEIEANIVFPNA